MPRSTFTADYATFLRLLRRLRRESGVTQVHLAKRLRMTQSAVSKCERGERRLDIIELRAWCATIDVSLRDFADELDRALGRPRNDTSR